MVPALSTLPMIVPGVATPPFFSTEFPKPMMMPTPDAGILPVDVPETLTAIIPLLTTLPMRMPPAALDFAAVALPPPAKAVMAWALAAVAVLVELATIVPLLTIPPRNTPPVLRAADDWATPPLA